MLLLVYDHLLSSLETIPKIIIFQGDCGRWLGVGAKHITYYSSHFNTLAPDSCEHCLPLVDRTFKLLTGPLTLQLHSTVRVPLREHNFSQYEHI